MNTRNIASLLDVAGDSSSHVKERRTVEGGAKNEKDLTKDRAPPKKRNLQRHRNAFGAKMPQKSLYRWAPCEQTTSPRKRISLALKGSSLESLTAQDRDTNGYYAARAGEYDNVYLKADTQGELRLIEHWLPPIFRGQRVLEIACGTGYWTRFVSQTADHVVALDITPEMIAYAVNRAYRRNVEFVLGDAYALSRFDSLFDAAFAGFWFSHVPRQRWREFLRALFLRLSPGAKVVMLDSRHTDDYHSPIIERDVAGNTYQSRRLNDGTTFRVLKNFPSEAELRTLAADLEKEVSFTVWEAYWAFTFSN